MITPSKVTTLNRTHNLKLESVSKRIKKNKIVRTDEHLYEELKRLKKKNARLIEERDLLKKQRRTLPGSNGEVRLIKQHEPEFSVKSMCGS